MSKFYLAAGFSRKDEISKKCTELHTMGIGTTSSWVHETAAANSTLAEVGDEYLQINGNKDIQEIDEANGIILFTQDPTKPFVRGGRMHEFGYAHGKGKRLIVCGPRENIFHYLPQVEVFDTWETLLKTLEAECLTQN